MGGHPVPLEKRFWDKVDVRGPDECWIWKAALNEHGYGVIGDVRPHNILAHRAAYQFAHNIKLEKGAGVYHKCDTPACVNPNHLFRGTQKDNLTDMRKKGRGKIPGYSGSKHPMAVLNETDVAEIKKLLAMKMPQRKIAKLFDVTQGCIAHIAKGDSWKNIKAS